MPGGVNLLDRCDIFARVVEISIKLCHPSSDQLMVFVRCENSLANLALLGSLYNDNRHTHAKREVAAKGMAMENEPEPKTLCYGDCN